MSFKTAVAIPAAFFAALSVTCLVGLNAAHAGPGHDHGEAAPAAGGNSPKRQSDGRVFLPKASQRHLEVRTQVAALAEHAQVVELTGRVLADPGGSGKVQANQAGRLEATARGVATVGQRVRKGEVLAVVRSSVTAMERAAQSAQLAELAVALALANKRAARLDALEGVVARKDIEAARSDVASITQRRDAMSVGVAPTEVLVAPVSGVISVANVVAGQVVDAREVLFEIIDPDRLLVEASAFDASLASQVKSATASARPGHAVGLTFVRAGVALRDAALPLLFKLSADPAAANRHSLAVGQSVKVLVQTRQNLTGVAVSAQAVVKDASNQDQVWVHTASESFEPRPVRSQLLNGSTVVITSGLIAGDRVVVQASSLINQVR